MTTTKPILPLQAQFTHVLEALRALDYGPNETLLGTDDLIDDARSALNVAFDMLCEKLGFQRQEWPAPTDAERTAWLEQRCFEQREAGLR